MTMTIVVLECAFIMLVLMMLVCFVMQAGHEAQVELQMSDDSTQVQFDFHKCALKGLSRVLH